jgi:hypothetical protein
MAGPDYDVIGEDVLPSSNSADVPMRVWFFKDER